MLWEQGAAGSNPATSTLRKQREPHLIDGVFVTPQLCQLYPHLVIFIPIRDTKLGIQISFNEKLNVIRTYRGQYNGGYIDIKRGTLILRLFYQ